MGKVALHPVIASHREMAKQKSVPLCAEQRDEVRKGLMPGANFPRQETRAQTSQEFAAWHAGPGQEMSGIMAEAKYNAFGVPDKTFIDLLTDSGTSTPLRSQEKLWMEWASEVSPIVTRSYARPLPRLQLNLEIADLFGEQFLSFPAKQGRTAENFLLQSLIANGVLDHSVILCNRPFDTTLGHIKDKGCLAISCTKLTTPEVFHGSDTVFLGNVDMGRMKTSYDVVRDYAKAVLVTVTDNGGGGQPVSMQNIREVAAFAKEKGLLVWIDACRIFENALFIHAYEPGYENVSIEAIAREMLSYADVVTLSTKKMYAGDGGAILINRDSKLLEDKIRGISTFIKRKTTVDVGNGFDSYAGLKGETMIEMIAGLRAATDPELIAKRIIQVRKAYSTLRHYKFDGKPFPVVGGAHALYIAADQVLPNAAQNREHCAAEMMQAHLLEAIGIRGAPLGDRLYGTWVKSGGVYRLKIPAEMDSLRLAIPRNTFDDNILLTAMAAIGSAYQEGVFHNVTAGMDAIGYNTSGFFHFDFEDGGYSPRNPGEYANTVRQIREIAMATFGLKGN